MAFNAFKPGNDLSDKSYTTLIQAFTNAGETPSDYTIVYGYQMKSGLFKKTMLSYAIGLSLDKSKLVILAIDLDGNVGEKIVVEISNITKAKYNLQGALTIKANGRANDITVTIPPYTPKNAESMYQLPIAQEENEELVRTFIKGL